MTERTASATNNATSSIRRAAPSGSASLGSESQSRNGAKIRTPIASPAHHTDHAAGKRSLAIAPERTSVPAPIVALIPMLRSAASATSRTTSRIRSIERWKPLPSRSQAPTSGAAVFPTAVAAAASALALIGRFTRNAAIAIAGHRRFPRRRNATSAIPVGGQSGVMLWPIRAKRRLNRAAT